MSSEPVPDPDSRALLPPGATAPPGTARLCRCHHPPPPPPPPPRAGQPTPSCSRGEALTARPGRRFYPESMSWERLQQVRSLVDAMGARSAKAQGLACPITSLHKLAGSSQRLYVSARQRAEQRMEVLGILKAGPKNLFIRDDAGRFHEICPPCVLDFYVHESCQRQGVGRALFEAYLSDQRTTAAGSGYDRPSPKFLAFLRKHYHLASYVPQANNFVVFREYFEHRGAAAMGAGASGDASGGSTAGGGWSSISQRPLTPTHRELFARRRTPTPPQPPAGAYLSAAIGGVPGSEGAGWHPLPLSKQVSVPHRRSAPAGGSAPPWGYSEDPAAGPSRVPAEPHAPLYGRRAGRLTSYQHAHSNFLYSGNPERGGGVAAPRGVPPVGTAERNGGPAGTTAWKPPLPVPLSEGGPAGAGGGGEARVAKHGRRAPRALGGALPLQGGGGEGRLRMAANYSMQGGRGAASCLVW